MYQLEKIQPRHYDFTANNRPDIDHPIDRSESDEEYEIGYLLDLVDKANDWDEKVVEDYTATEVLYSLAYEVEIDTDGLESEEDFSQGVLEAVKDYFDFEEEKVGIYHYDFENHHRLYSETRYQVGYLYHLVDKAKTWDEEVLPSYTALDILFSLVSAYNRWHYAPLLESADSIFQTIQTAIEFEEMPTDSEDFASKEETGRQAILEKEKGKVIESYVTSVRQGIQKGQKEQDWLQALDKLRQMKGCEEIVTQLESEWVQRKRDLRTERQAEREALKEAEKDSNPNVQFLTLSMGRIEIGFLDKGSLYEYEGNVYEVIFKEFFEEDRLDLGSDDYAYYEIDLKLLDEDDDRVIEYRTHKAESIAKAQRRKEARSQAVRKLSRTAKKGEPIKESFLFKITDNALMLNSDLDDYTRGELLFLKGNEIFLIINDHLGGLNPWSRFKITTDKTELYGYHIPLTPELKDSVEVLIKG